MRGILAASLISAACLYGQGAPDSFDALSRQAEAARDAEHLDQAMTFYQRALVLKPAWDEGWWNLGSIAYDLNRYRECAPAFQSLAKLRPASAPAWTMAGLCQYRLHHYQDALASLNRAAELKFDGPAELARSARLHLALVLTKLGAWERAIAELTELTRVYKKSNDVVVAAGIAGLRKSWLPAEVPQPSRELVYGLGDAMASAMEFDLKEATSKFQALAEKYPREANVHFRYGAFLNTQDSAKGIQEIRKAVELEPDHIPALVGLTVIYLKQEDLAHALEYGQRAVQAGPTDFSTHVVLGRVLLAKEDPAGAARELESAVKLAPESPDAHFSLASAYTRLGRKQDAAHELAEFKRLEHFEK